MKSINETFEDSEHEFLKEKKGDKSWHDYILHLAGYIKE